MPFKGIKIDAGRFLDLSDMDTKFRNNWASRFGGVW